jgi:dTDP-glucose 4,6-dehydratase
VRILVTGGLGFIGANFITLVRRERPEWEIVNVDKVTYAGRYSTDLMQDGPHYRFARADITDQEAMREAMATVDAIVHFAAESHVDRSIDGPGDFVVTNVLGTQVLLDLARQLGVGLFLHISTDEVYGDLEDGKPATEEAPLRPSSPYSASKAAADLLVLAYHRTYDLPVRITRCSNNLGPRQYPEKLIPVLIAHALRDLPLPLYGDGRNVRDWIHVEDHCRAVLAVLEHGQDGRVYNIGAAQERENRQVAEAVLRVLGKPDHLVAQVADRPGHDRRYALDSSRIRKELGWAPRYDFEQALEATVAWYLEHPRWLEAVAVKR